jgi:crotonobetainyl-CoA:carnitine CoA-transferase CaiB-like acyl-CoA transferase
MLSHPQTLARDMVVAVDHPVAGRVETIGVPAKFSGTPTEIARPAPLYGQHTREVLSAAGFSRSEIDALIAEGAAKETPLPRAAAE